jgi:hypothetical protein
MAGVSTDFRLEPGQTQFDIPTNLFGSTTVTVFNGFATPGRISMTAGGSPAEFGDILPRVNGQNVAVTHLRRNFRGVLLAIKNEGDVELAFSTT